LLDPQSDILPLYFREAVFYAVEDCSGDLASYQLVKKGQATGNLEELAHIHLIATHNMRGRKTRLCH
jgi:hypothetical protein